MPVMPFEGLQDEAPEDVFTFIVTEPTHTVEDEAWYCDTMIPGAAGYLDEDERHGFECERDFPEDYFTESELDHFAQVASDRYEAAMTAHW